MLSSPNKITIQWNEFNKIRIPGFPTFPNLKKKLTGLNKTGIIKRELGKFLIKYRKTIQTGTVKKPASHPKL